MEDRYLFKAKRLDNGEWVIGNLIQSPFFKGVRSWISSEKEDKTRLRSISRTQALWNSIEVDSSTICQCTGLKDKNGKLIWENDIISYQRDNDDCPFPNKDTKKRLGKVFYKVFRTTFAIGMGKNGSKSLNDDLWKYVQNGNRVEVIGNIFDNKDLLESEEK